MEHEEEVHDLEKFHEACCALPNFRTASTKSSPDLTLSMESLMSSEDSVRLIKTLIERRKELSLVLDTNDDPLKKLTVIEKYVTPIFQMFHSLQSDGQTRMHRKLSFEWKYLISCNKEAYTSSDVLFEVIMLLFSKAIVHVEVGKSFLSLSKIDNLTETGKHLLAAASIMQFLHNNIVSGKWKRLFNSTKCNPDECNSQVCLALSWLFRGSAQAMAVMKALSGTSDTSATFKARLCLSVVNSMRQSFSILLCHTQNSGGGYAELLIHIAAKRQLFLALVYLYLAQSCSDKKDMGLATAYCSEAKSMLAEQKGVNYYPNKPGLPNLASVYLPACFPAAVALLRAKIDALFEHVDGENRFIYFLVVPTQLPELPPEACVMVPPPFQEPVVDPVELGPPRSEDGSAKKSSGFFASLLKRKSSRSRSDALSPSSSSSKSSLASTSTEDLTVLVPPSCVGSPVSPLRPASAPGIQHAAKQTQTLLRGEVVNRQIPPAGQLEKTVSEEDRQLQDLRVKIGPAEFERLVSLCENK